MISVVLYGRNDNYGYNLHKRAALSLNCMAEVLSDDGDEILFVDYNTPSDYPTFPEAIADTLTEKCRRLLRVLRIRPEIHERLFAARTHLKALEPVSRNAAVRRSNPLNDWILSTNTDMIFVPRDGQSLSNVIRALPQKFYCAPRIEIPETAWEGFNRMDAAAVIDTVRSLGAEIHLDDIIRGEDVILYDGPGDFQLIRRSDLFAIDGFHEGMLRGWHVDANISKRLTLLHGEVGDAAPFVLGYHCDHTRQVTPAHSHDSPENDSQMFVNAVDRPDIPEQHETWGLRGIDLEEIEVASGSSKTYIDALRASIGTPLAQPTISNYRSDSFDLEPASPQHVLPFLSDLFVTRPRNTALAWVGVHGEMLQLFEKCWAGMGFSRPVGAERNSEAKAKQIEAANVFVINFGVPNVISPEDDNEILKDFWSVMASERDHIETGAEPRQIIAINAVHNRFESLVRSYLFCAKTPFSPRLRHGYLNKSAFETRQDWTRAILPGVAGQRTDGNIATNGNAGHVFCGPYRVLTPGVYEFALRITVPAPERVRIWGARRARASFAFEVVVDEQERVSRRFRLAPGTNTLQLEATISSADFHKAVQVRLHSSGGSVAVVQAVHVRRVGVGSGAFGDEQLRHKVSD